MWVSQFTDSDLDSIVLNSDQIESALIYFETLDSDLIYLFLMSLEMFPIILIINLSIQNWYVFPYIINFNEIDCSKKV